MRLRYLHVKDLPPLEDVAIEFKHESLLGRQCAIRFVVGVNGSGKTRLLRALTEVFVQLERASELELPFPVTIAYDIGRDDTAHTVYLRYPGKREGSRFAIFDQVLPDTIDWENIDLEDLPDDRLYKDGDLPGASAIASNMPNPLIAYTSGDTRLWRAIFDAPPRDLDVKLDEDVKVRPPGWTVQQERAYLASDNADNSTEPEVEISSTSRSRVAYMVTMDDLKLATLAVTLVQAVNDLKKYPIEEAKEAFGEELREAKFQGRIDGGLRGLLNEVDWVWPIYIGLHIELDMNSLLVRRQRARLERLYKAATSAIKQPGPSHIRLLSFDLQRPTLIDDKNELLELVTARALALALADSEGEPKAFEIYRTLYELRQQGILKGVEIALQKINLPYVLLYDWLSDGEQEFLGRMSLFNLLHDQDDALVILDEPETHFNDVWKRRIVDIIDDSLRDNASEVVISTHSSIALTDVFETEITLLRKDAEDGTVAVVRQPAINTFGASPNEIMRHIFNAPDTVGQRATEFLDMFLMAISQPEDVEAMWRIEGNPVEQSEPFLRLYQSLRLVPHDYGDESEAQHRLLDTLQAVRRFAEGVTGQPSVSVADVVNVFRDRLGPGYYEFEFNRRLRALQQRR
jgi:ABC-type transport system involved in cytochrome c biogenesis ATPase subunit